MKSNAHQPSFGDVPSDIVRSSDRIKARRERQSTQVNPPQKPVAAKTARQRSTGGKSKAPAQKNPTQGKFKEHPQKKEARPRLSKVPPAQKIRKKALQELERRAANDPLPQDLARWNLGRAPVLSEDLDEQDVSGLEMSVYDPLMPERLTEYGVFDEMWSEDGKELKGPNNMGEIIEAIKPLQNDSSNRAKLEHDYKCWIDAILESTLNEENTVSWFNGYMDVDNFPLPHPHFKSSKLQWKPLPDSQIKMWKPSVDFVEGIIGRLLPRWVSDALGSYIRPDVAMTVALPNLMVEFKGNGSMKIAHQQVRLAGGYACQSLYKLYEYLHKLGESGDEAAEHYRNLHITKKFYHQALVGSIEFNSEVIVGNVHWATKSKNTGRKVDYHMRRVMCHFTRGLGFDDFVEARTQARNFRRYFADLREKILEELEALPRPAERGNYDRMKKSQLQEECKKRHLRHGGNVPELRDRLRAHDGGGPPNRAASVATSHTDTQVTAVDRLTPSVGTPDMAMASFEVRSQSPPAPQKRKSREGGLHRGPAKKLSYGASQ